MPAEPISVLCLGAHSDDLEIGVGGTLLGWLATRGPVNVHWCVLSAGNSQRRSEAMAGARAVLKGAASQEIERLDFRVGYYPLQGEALNDWFEPLKQNTSPDNNILEYAIQKWDGNLRDPNVIVPCYS